MTFDERIKKKTSVKTTFHDIKAASGELERIAHDLHSVKTVLAAICWMQDDRALHVPFDVIAKLPPGVELQITVDKVNGNYEFLVIEPHAEKNPPG